MPIKVKQPHGGEIHLLQKGESGNLKGRPRRLVSTVIAELKESGIDAVSKTEVNDLFKRMQNHTYAELKAMATSPGDVPMLVALVARGLCGKDGWKVVGDMMDRTGGKARQEPDIPMAGESAVEKTFIELPGGLSLEI